MVAQDMAVAYSKKIVELEAEVRVLREALGEAGIVLEALNIAQGTALTAEIANAVDIIRRALAPEPTRSRGAHGA